MNTLAMIAGMLPIAPGLGADASFRQPMAIAVIGGLVTSPLLSLLVMPVVSSFVHGFEAGMRSRFARPPSAIGRPGPAGEAVS